MLIIRAITLWHSNASFAEAICSPCWEKTRNHIPEDVSQLEGGDDSPETAEGGDKMWLCQKPTVTITVWEQRVRKSLSRLLTALEEGP